MPTELYEVKQNSAASLGIYYSNHDYPTANLTIYTVNYYDGYTFDRAGAPTTTNSYGVNSTNKLQGLATGSRVRVLDTDDWITTVTYYDEKARPIYAYAQNDYLETTDIVESKLEDFTGKVLETRTTHQKTGHQDIITIDRFKYDHMDRLISQSQKVNTQFSERIVRNNYDDLGQLKSKLTGNGTRKGYTDITKGISIDRDMIEKTEKNGWNHGLATLGSIQADGYVEFKTTSTNKWYMAGLSSDNTNASYTTIDFAVYIAGSTIRIYESGSHKKHCGTFTAGDVFRVERQGSTIYYKKNDDIMYISTQSSTGNLLGDISIHSSWTQIKDFHIVDNSKGLQNVDYDYNVRGWLKKINEDAQNDNDLFNFTLRYNDPTSGTPLFNGNISQTSWNSTSVNSTNNPVSNLYSYNYDALNRITSATDNTGNYNLTGVSYDKNGNILTLQRTGHIDASATQFGMMDNLAYSYDGNQLLNVTDTSNEDFGFKDVTAPVDDYDYDANGNMTEDEE